MLKEMEIDELIASSKDEYIELSLKLLADQKFYLGIKDKISKNKHKLFNNKNVSTFFKNFVEKNKNPKVEVYFKGYSNKSDFYYKKSHLLINTSHFEGSNNSIIESINHNPFVMASDCPGGNKELINLFLYVNTNDLVLFTALLVLYVRASSPR